MGTPLEIYEHPATVFVAGFVGTTNLLSGDAARAVLGRDVVATIRPERIRMIAPGAAVAADAIRCRGTVFEVLYLGAETRFVVALDAGGRLLVSRPNTSDHTDAAPGSAVVLSWREDDVRLISDPTTTSATTRGNP